MYQRLRSICFCVVTFATAIVATSASAQSPGNHGVPSTIADVEQPPVQFAEILHRNIAQPRRELHEKLKEDVPKLNSLKQKAQENPGDVDAQADYENGLSDTYGKVLGYVDHVLAGKEETLKAFDEKRRFIRVQIEQVQNDRESAAKNQAADDQQSQEINTVLNQTADRLQGVWDPNTPLPPELNAGIEIKVDEMEVADQLSRLEELAQQDAELDLVTLHGVDRQLAEQAAALKVKYAALAGKRRIIVRTMSHHASRIRMAQSTTEIKDLTGVLADIQSMSVDFGPFTFGSFISRERPASEAVPTGPQRGAEFIKNLQQQKTPTSLTSAEVQ